MSLKSPLHLFLIPPPKPPLNLLSLCCLTPGNAAGHSSDSRWPRGARLHFRGYGECGTARSPRRRGRRVWFSRAPCRPGCSNPLINPTSTPTSSYSTQGQTIGSAWRGQVLSWRCRILGTESRQQVSNTTTDPLSPACCATVRGGREGGKEDVLRVITIRVAST